MVSRNSVTGTITGRPDMLSGAQPAAQSAHSRGTVRLASAELASTAADLRDERNAAELREQFMGILGHDLRNPLAAIGSGLILLARTPLNERGAMLVGGMQQSVARMTELARIHWAKDEVSELTARTLRQMARELLLAQSSDWPFILRTGTSPDYARKRVKDHILRFIALHEQLTTTSIDEPWLAGIESMDNIFPDLDYRYWA